MTRPGPAKLSPLPGHTHHGPQHAIFRRMFPADILSLIHI